MKKLNHLNNNYKLYQFFQLISSQFLFTFLLIPNKFFFFKLFFHIKIIKKKKVYLKNNSFQ
jgi:hypothetical protein